MRLYAKIQSERGKEIGKGGNDILSIDVLVYDRSTPRYHIEVTPDNFTVTERGYNQPRMVASHKDIREQSESKK